MPGVTSLTRASPSRRHCVAGKTRKSGMAGEPRRQHRQRRTRTRIGSSVPAVSLTVTASPCWRTSAWAEPPANWTPAPSRSNGRGLLADIEALRVLDVPSLRRTHIVKKAQQSHAVMPLGLPQPEALKSDYRRIGRSPRKVPATSTMPMGLCNLSRTCPARASRKVPATAG